MFKPRCPVCGAIMGELVSPVPASQRNYTFHCVNHPDGKRVYAGLGLAGYLYNKEYWTFYIPVDIKILPVVGGSND